VRYITESEENRLRQAVDAREEKIRSDRANANKWREKRSYPLMPDLQQQHFADYIKPMILLPLNTGLRQGELFNVKWIDINFERKIVTITGDIAKSGKTRHVPLNEEAFTALQIWYL
jgi:integrase